MTAEEKATEYAIRYSAEWMISQVEDAWMDGYNADRWIPAPKDVTEFPMDTQCIFLIPVRNSKLNIKYWDVVSGYIDPENYTDIQQTNDDDCGWNTDDIAFYQVIGTLPPLPSFTTEKP